MRTTVKYLGLPPVNFEEPTGCLSVEAELHHGWLATRPEVAISPVTSAYTDVLLATTLGTERAVGAAAVLLAVRPDRRHAANRFR